MRTLLLALLLAAPLSAQTLSGGLGVGWGSSVEMLSVGGTVTAPVGEHWTVGVHAGYTEEIVLSNNWRDRQTAGALLAGRSGRSGLLEWTALAGPSLSSALRQPNVSPAQPSEARLEPGVMARVRGGVAPLRSVPVSLSLDLGLNVATGGVTTSLLPGLAVRLGR